MTDFHLAVHQNEFLPRGSTDVHAVITVNSAITTGAITNGALTGTAEPPAGVPSSTVAGPAKSKVVIVMGDVSGSMQEPIDPNDKKSTVKLHAAIDALIAAVAQIEDGTEFAVIAGRDFAEMVYPSGRSLAVADADTRREASVAISQLQATGGTAISTWLNMARRIFETRPNSINLGILITDGRNESEKASVFEKEIERCIGVFECDCRGIGVNWNVAELRKVASALLGDVDMIRESALMQEDFKGLISTAMAKQVSDVRLHIWTPKSSKLLFLKQVAPAIEDITDRGTSVSELIRSFPTATWGIEERDYHICVQVNPGEIGDEMLAARVSLTVEGTTVSQGLVRAVWTEDVGLSTRIVPEVAHYTGQVKLAAAIQEGLAARADGDTHTATVKLGEAVKLATESGNSQTVKLLEKVVDVENPMTGTVRLKAAALKGDEMELDTRSTKTVRVKKG
jgi:hypothetical protein